MSLQKNISNALSEITHLILDVDGTLTNGELVYNNNGSECKKFSVYDGIAIKIAIGLGVNIIILSGRTSAALEIRASDLGIMHVVQGIENKKKWLQSFMSQNSLTQNNLAYIGDDLNDYTAMQLTSFVACPVNSAPEVQKLAHYVSSKKGGEGAVREILQFIFCVRGQWEQVIKDVYGISNC